MWQTYAVAVLIVYGSVALLFLASRRTRSLWIMPSLVALLNIFFIWIAFHPNPTEFSFMGATAITAGLFILAAPMMIVAAASKAVLLGMPPNKQAPTDTIGFTLVLLSKTNDRGWLREALATAGCLRPEEVDVILRDPCPQLVASGLTADDALLGQFELACADSIAVFLRDEVVSAADSAYLKTLYSELLASDEFTLVDVEIRSVRLGKEGLRFLRQFIGSGALFANPPHASLRRRVMRKKARIMLHWGAKIGADVRVFDT